MTTRARLCLCLIALCLPACNYFSYEARISSDPIEHRQHLAPWDGRTAAEPAIPVAPPPPPEVPPPEP